MDALAAEIAKKRKQVDGAKGGDAKRRWVCLLYTSPSPRDS